jgi:hypothetical protein
MRLAVALLVFLALVAGCAWVVRSRRVGVLLVASIVLALACMVEGALFIASHSPECLLPGGVLVAGGAVALSGCTVALALWVDRGGKA